MIAGRRSSEALHSATFTRRVCRQVEEFMDDSVQACMARLRALAHAGAANPRPAAAEVVRSFMATAKENDRARLKAALEDARLVGLNTDVAPPFLPEHDRWLAALEGACAAA